MNNTYRIGERSYNCPLMLSHSVFMGKWKGMIIWALLEHRVLRYGQLKKGISELAKISDKMLIESLKELEIDGIISRKSYDTIPPKVEYSLTDKGLGLRNIWDLLWEFGEAYRE